MSLYKYVDEGRVDILEKGLIRFTPPHAFNDPFEMRPFFRSLCSDDYSQQNLENLLNSLLDKEYEKLSEEKKSDISIEKFKELVWLQEERISIAKALLRSEGLAKIIQEPFDQGFTSKIGILCLTEKPDNLIMWAHYSNSHQGFVIEFDKYHKFFNQRRSGKDEFGYLRKVGYSPERPKIILSDFESDSIDLDTFLLKSREWEYEEEWRMLMPLKNCENEKGKEPHIIHLFAFPPQTIKSLFLGCRMEADNEATIRELISRNTELSHIKLFKSVLNDREFSLRFEEV